MHTKIHLLLGTVVLLLINGCSLAKSTQAPGTATPTAVQTATPTAVSLTPYASPTPTPTPSPPPTAKAPTPTPTPFFYIVKKGDTLLGIALKLGVSLKELKEANPGVNPNALSVGAKLLIPINRTNPAALPTPTPMPLSLGEPLCAAAPDGSLTCLCKVANHSNTAVGAVELDFTVGKQIFKASALMDLLLPHSSTIVMARATPPAIPLAHPKVKLRRGVAVPNALVEEAYPEVRLTVQSIKFTPNRLGATIQGTVTLPKGKVLSEIWILAMAYDKDGHPVGVRRVEIVPPANKTTTALKFSVGVYSIGVPIAKVELAAEAHSGQ